VAALESGTRLRTTVPGMETGMRLGKILVYFFIFVGLSFCSRQEGLFVELHMSVFQFLERLGLLFT
jgi:hypothetical protein